MLTLRFLKIKVFFIGPAAQTGGYVTTGSSFINSCITEDWTKIIFVDAMI